MTVLETVFLAWVATSCAALLLVPVYMIVDSLVFDRP